MENPTIIECDFDGKSGYKFGENGKCFTYNLNKISKLKAFEKAVDVKMSYLKQQKTTVK